MPYEPPPEYVRQERYEIELLISQLKELADKHDKLCTEVIKNRIDIAVIWTKVAFMSAGISAAISIIAAIIVGALKIMPAIIKILNAPK